jgi:16S rRNA (adenine1518-N6/adenine1519-N6)-dimethyltransferase
MDLFEKTQEICKLYDIWPARSKGQNFLIAENVYDEIIKAAGLSKEDTVLEVGPGLGFLTAKLAKAAGKVIAVELDDKLAAYLRDAITAGETENVEVFNENILDFNLEKDFLNKTASLVLATHPVRAARPPLPRGDFKVVANLPYNITSVFLRKFLTSENKPESMVLMLQKEVAERICAKPGDMSLLALSVQFYAEPEIIAYVPKENFWPRPAVDSAIIRIRTKNKEQRTSADVGTQNLAFLPAIEEKDFFRLAKFGFSAKRKMLKNNLAGGLHIAPAEAEKILVAAGLNPKARAEDLSIEDWGKIIKQRT